jgi:hypothetical protein
MASGGPKPLSTMRSGFGEGAGDAETNATRRSGAVERACGSGWAPHSSARADRAGLPMNSIFIAKISSELSSIATGTQ